MPLPVLRKRVICFQRRIALTQNSETLLILCNRRISRRKRSKRKGIIGQEIQMYLDDPNWRLFLAF